MMRAHWRPRLLLFDLDGTLVDSAPDLIAALQKVRAALSLAPIAGAPLRAHVSQGGAAVLRAGLPELAAAEAETHLDRLLAHYRAALCVDTRLFEGIAELLDRWTDAGAAMGIVTNKTAALTLPLLDALSLRERFAVVVCGDTLAERKPHPAPVLHACAAVGVDAGEALYVGDDRRDIEAGRAAGTRTATAEWGYVELEHPANWGADFRFAGPSELSDWLWPSKPNA